MRLLAALQLLAPLAAALLVACGTAGPGEEDGAIVDGVKVDHTEAQAWITSDPKHAFEHQAPVALGAPSAALPTIHVDDSTLRQSVEGFGAALTDASAAIMHYELGPTERKALLEKLMSPSSGLGLSMLRLPIAASDSTWHGAYSYDDWGDAHGGDKSLSHFSVAHDEAYIIPTLQEIVEHINPEVRIIATPWSPPAWMKHDDAGMIGGELRNCEDSTYADYLVRFVRAYWQAHIPIYALTPQNEPGQPANYPSMSLPPSDEAALIAGSLAPALDKAHFGWVRILGFDHNWGDAYPDQLLESLEAKHALSDLDGMAFHCYGGDPAKKAEALTTLHDDPRMKDKDIFVTECDRSEKPDGENAGHDEGIQKLIDAMNNWSRSYMAWQLVLHPDGTPNQGSGCMKKAPDGTVIWHCVGVVSVDPKGGKVTEEWDYAYLGHASKFVKRGARVVGVAPLGSVESVGFVNPDGSRILVAYNASTEAQKFQVEWHGKAFAAKVPARSAATFAW